MTNLKGFLRFILLFIVLLSCLTGIPAMGYDSTSTLKVLAQGLPAAIDNWNKSSDFAVYDSDNLYTYINGGAELFISFKFINLVSLSYGNEEDEEIMIDIFDMGSSQNAYGIFSHGRETIDDFVGADIESEYAGGLLTFWKEQYYVSILAYPETESKKLLVQTLGKKIAEQIRGASVKPQLVDLLPEDSLQLHSIKYFTHYAWLNTYHFFSNENLLNIDNKTEVVMAKYQVNAAKPAVLIVLQYHDQAAAVTAQNTFKQKFMTDDKNDYTIGVDQLWIGCVRDKDLLVIVVDAPDMETAKRIVKGVE
ncbi:MAG: hypothetical protein HKP52_07490 [Desulfofustis sp.]|nr:hypothetical protein [Desulfofustis sp.]